MKPDLSTWPTKDETRTILDLSLSQINNLVKAKRLEVKLRKRPGQSPVGVVNPADVQREKDLRANALARPHILPPGSPEPEPARKRPGLLSGESTGLYTAPLVPLTVKLWLSLDEAIAFSGLGRGRLQELAREGKIAKESGPNGTVVLRRSDLEKL